jgi:hypothetical protein
MSLNYTERTAESHTAGETCASSCLGLDVGTRVRSGFLICTAVLASHLGPRSFVHTSCSTASLVQRCGISTYQHSPSAKLPSIASIPTPVQRAGVPIPVPTLASALMFQAGARHAKTMPLSSPSRHYNATYRSSVVPMYIRSCYIGRPRHMSLTSQTGSRRASACQHVR